MGYNICHNKNHVTAEKECTKVPYGDVSLYDPSCHPYSLTLVGLTANDDIPLVDGSNLPDLWVCIRDTHGHRSCATQAQKSLARKRFDEVSKHEWARFYEEGEYVLVRGRVVQSAFGSYRGHVQVAFHTGFTTVARDSIVSLTDKPHPDEPDHKLVLRSHQNGRFMAYRDGHWRNIDTVPAPGMEWKAAWAQYGPFDLFKPEGKI